ncbi:MAG: repressor LexA [Planctomycetaceae bacterium]|nr:repressor LexA [Planctomycetaceae bacterium]
MPGRKTSLTKRQREIYEFLKEKITNRGYGPTVREIGVEFDIRSPNGVMCHLKALERKGLIQREQNMSRAIQLAETPQNRLNVPLLGVASASGTMHRAVSGDERVSFQSVLGGNDVACLRIEGAAYSSINVVHGDYLIVNRDLPIQAGCHVVTQDDRHAVIICAVQEGSNQLVPLIPTGYASVTRQVVGVITGVIRQFRTPQIHDALAADLSSE